MGGGSAQPSTPVLSVREERVSPKEVSQIPLLRRRGIEWWEAKHLLAALINPPQNAPKRTTTERVIWIHIFVYITIPPLYKQ